MSLGPDLPAGLADPLHILEPAGFPFGWLLALLLLAGWLARRFLRRPPTTTPEPVPARSPEPLSPTSIKSLVEQIRNEYTRHRDWRGGCHALASLVRQQLDLRNRAQLEDSATAMTSRELEAQLGDTAASRTLKLLGDLQFLRHEPSRSDFHGACELAGQVLETGSPSDPLL